MTGEDSAEEAAGEAGWDVDGEKVLCPNCQREDGGDRV